MKIRLNILVRLKMSYMKKSNLSGLNIIAFAISTVFFMWGIFAFNDMLWNFGTNWVGFLWFGLSLLIIFSQIGSINARKTSKRVFQEIILNPNDSLEEISYKTGVPLSSVKKVIVDLKFRGILTSSFNPQTGHLENANLVSPVPLASPRPIAATILSPLSAQSYVKNEEREFSREKPKYCTYCGSTLRPGATKYCEFCGQAL